MKVNDLQRTRLAALIRLSVGDRDANIGRKFGESGGDRSQETTPLHQAGFHR